MLFRLMILGIESGHVDKHLVGKRDALAQETHVFIAGDQGK